MGMPFSDDEIGISITDFAYIPSHIFFKVYPQFINQWNLYKILIF
jgi:hypothetical protein